MTPPMLDGAAPDRAIDTAIDAVVPADAAHDANDAAIASGAPGAPSAVTAVPIDVAANVSTLAGSGTDGYQDGTGTGADFSQPNSVGLDAVGNVYVTDRYNHRIRKVTPAGVVTTLAGSGICQAVDGTGTDASFCYPSGVVLDPTGNVYIADKGNHRVRKITPAGVVTTLAGSDTQTVADGPIATATFSSPSGIARDAAGNLYVADNSTEFVNNNRIRKITPAGVVSTLAGSDVAGSADGTGAAASFNNPIGVAADGAGTVYVTDEIGNSIRRVTAAGVVTTLAGSGTAGHLDGTGTAASFYNPVGVAVDAAGNVFVGGFRDGRIRRITIAGVASTLAGSDDSLYADGPGSMAAFNYPYGVAVDAAHNVFVADYFNERIRKVATVGIGELAVKWSAPSTAGTSPITSYTASAVAGGHATQTCTTTGATTCTIRGLLSGVTYSVSVSATNAAGGGPVSASTSALPN
jgi:sugar lactone lactonase YvrE